MGLVQDDTVGSLPRDQANRMISQHRGNVQFGLRSRPLGTITIQITAGSGSATWLYKEGTTALHAAVTYATSLNNVALLIAQAINNNASAHNWVATVSTDTITLRQRRGGASGTIALTATGDAAGAPANSGNPTGDTDTWTEVVSGVAFDGDLYYELSWSGALVVGGVAPSADVTSYGGGLTNATLTKLNLYSDGQAMAYWLGGLRAISTAASIASGIPVASAEWSRDIYNLNNGQPLVIKVAADNTALHYEASYI